MNTPLDKTLLQPLSYSLKTVQNLTGLSRSALYKAMNDKRLPFKKYGKRTFILVEDLEQFISKEFL